MSENWSWPGSLIARVIDGDTVRAVVTRDLGFHGSARFTVKLRLARINAGPIRSAAGQAAAAFLRELLPTPTPVLVETIGPYKYGDEWVAEITLPDGRNVSDVMVASGHALSWDGRGPRPGG